MNSGVLIWAGKIYFSWPDLEMLVLPIKIKQEKQKLAATSTSSNITATFAHSLFTRSKAKRHQMMETKCCQRFAQQGLLAG